MRRNSALLPALLLTASSNTPSILDLFARYPDKRPNSRRITAADLDRIAAAQAKRDRRAAKRIRNMNHDRNN